MFKPLICTAVLVLSSSFALAQAGSAPTDARQGDHQARRAEWQAKADARFIAADKNADGRLDRGEAQAVGERLAKNFDAMDANKDGLLDKAELAAMRGKGHRGGDRMRSHMAYQRGLFVGMDDDGDGAISRAELGNKAPKWVENFSVIDLDNNGKLSKDELRAYRKAAMQVRRAEHAG